MSSAEPRAVTEVDELVGERIRARRQELGLPLAHVAGEVGIAYQQLQKYEAGQNRVSVAALMRIAAALEVEAAVLLPSASKSLRARAPRAAPGDGMALQLQRAFARIPSAHERRLILDLAKRFAEGAAPTKRAAPKKVRRSSGGGKLRSR